uniref:Uncharacterized protein n=1 Tax=Romanomermis culicivorax TaxID=13658 RepID=A0A915JQZ1_ROMCU
MKINVFITLFACYQPISCAIRGTQKGATENIDLLAPLLEESDYLEGQIQELKIFADPSEADRQCFTPKPDGIYCRNEV